MTSAEQRQIVQPRGHLSAHLKTVCKIYNPQTLRKVPIIVYNTCPKQYSSTPVLATSTIRNNSISRTPTLALPSGPSRAALSSSSEERPCLKSVFVCSSTHGILFFNEFCSRTVWKLALHSWPFYSK